MVSKRWDLFSDRLGRRELMVSVNFSVTWNHLGTFYITGMPWCLRGMKISLTKPNRT
jgi:hypothetical protein